MQAGIRRGEGRVDGVCAPTVQVLGAQEDGEKDGEAIPWEDVRISARPAIPAYCHVLAKRGTATAAIPQTPFPREVHPGRYGTAGQNGRGPSLSEGAGH